MRICALLPIIRPKRAVLAELLAQHLDLAQRVLPLDDLVEQDLQPLRFDRLGQVVVGAFLDSFDRGFHGALRGQDHDGVLAAVVLQRAQQIQAAHARHDQVADDDGGAERGNSLERFFAVAAALGREAPGADELGEPTRVLGSSSTISTRSAVGSGHYILGPGAREGGGWRITASLACSFYTVQHSHGIDSGRGFGLSDHGNHAEMPQFLRVLAVACT